jgi:hypothetical protein
VNNLDRAWETLNSIDTGIIRDLAFLEFIQVAAQTSWQAAMQSIEAFDPKDPIQQEAYCIIMDAQRDPEIVFYIFLNIGNPSWGMTSWMFAMAKHDLSIAKNAASLQGNFESRPQALLEIVKVEVQQDIVGAKNTAYSIESIPFRDAALLEIVKVEAGQNIEEAQATADSITDQSQKDEAHLEIINVLAASDLAKAKSFVNAMGDSPCKTKGLLEIIKLETCQTPRAAMLTIESMDEPYEKALGLLEFAATYR